MQTQLYEQKGFEVIRQFDACHFPFYPAQSITRFGEFLRGNAGLAYLHSAVKQRFLVKKGSTWFWNLSATALVWVPE
jgi:hypothetical protein